MEKLLRPQLDRIRRLLQRLGPPTILHKLLPVRGRQGHDRTESEREGRYRSDESSPLPYERVTRHRAEFGNPGRPGQQGERMDAARLRPTVPVRRSRTHRPGPKGGAEIEIPRRERGRVEALGPDRTVAIHDSGR